MEDQDENLTGKQRRYAELLAGGMDSRQAAREAGYSDSFANVAAFRLKKIPAVVKALATIRHAAAKEAVYTLLAHVEEIDWAIKGAAEQNNWMAVARLVRDKGEVFGYYVQRVEVVTADLKGALEAAERRILNITPRQGAQLAEPAETGNAAWTTHIPGNSVGD